MDPRFFRKYADLITEAETEQLNEGVVDQVLDKAKTALAKIDKATMGQIASVVSQVLGKPADQITMADLNMQNAQKLGAWLNAGQQQGQPAVNEAFSGIKEKLKKLGWSLLGSAMGTGVAAMGTGTTHIPQTATWYADTAAQAAQHATDMSAAGIALPLIFIALTVLFYKGITALEKPAHYQVAQNREKQRELLAKANKTTPEQPPQA